MIIEINIMISKITNNQKRIYFIVILEQCFNKKHTYIFKSIIDSL